MKKLLTVEFDQKQEKVELHLNELGVEQLIKTLCQLQRGQQNENSHLMTSEWGGNELTSERQNQSIDSVLINHLKIFYWKE